MVEYLAPLQQHAYAIFAAVAAAAVTSLIAWLIHRRATRHWRLRIQNQEALTDEILIKLSESERRVAELELATEVARLDLLNLLQNIGPKDKTLGPMPEPAEPPNQTAHSV